MEQSGIEKVILLEGVAVGVSYSISLHQPYYATRSRNAVAFLQQRLPVIAWDIFYRCPHVHKVEMVIGKFQWA